MRIGIDLGTTRTVVAFSDRGNVPVVGFSTEAGDVVDHIPTVSAVAPDGALVHGHRAETLARQGAPHLRSWKRLLGRFGPEHRVQMGGVDVGLLDLATDFVRHLGEELRARSNLPPVDALPEAVVSVPAHARSSQRFATLEAFRRAGFAVRALVNEPSAAALEYAHRYQGKLNRKRDHVLVYDLGGGTFDAALVTVRGGDHDVVDTSGIAELGGDDFDAVLLTLALERAAIPLAEVRPHLPGLLDACREAKEAIGPNTRRVAVDLSPFDEHVGPVFVPVADYYDRLRPYIEHTLTALHRVMAPDVEGDGHGALEALKRDAAEAGVAGVYVVGGGSGLPIVSRILRERFGHRVQRSVHPSASTAMGLAIAASEMDAPGLHERFTRHLGVFREQRAGRWVSFDPIFARGTPVPAPGEPPLVRRRRYRPAHNIGHFRFVECGHLDGEGQPQGDVSPHGVVFFPYDRGLRHRDRFQDEDVARLEGVGPPIEERYEVDATGAVQVVIFDCENGFERRYRLG
ncbi:MAG: Hsp70 family protein [Myxococcota bacterium]